MDTPLSDSQALPPGTRIEEFLIERVLGSGGFGITYLARDTSLGRKVVIKENLPSQFAWRETATGTVRPRHSTGGDIEDYQWSMKNFLREVETLASLDHPGIVRVLRKFETNGTAYFVMPFVEGMSFDSLIDERRTKHELFSQDEILGLTTRVLDSLGYLHDRGIYHRNIKPGNILITMEGIPVLIDFVSARQRLSERSMIVIESAGYTSFEQLQSRGNVGPWSDLYALGGTLVKALTGEAPPKAMDRMRQDPYQPLAEMEELRARFTQGFLQGIDKSLAVEEEDRWQNAEEWLAELRDEVPAETRDAGEMYDLGFCYENGTGVTKNMTEAVKWYHKAAEAGDARGMYNLGNCYAFGRGVTKNITEAVKWYRKAADAGDARGMHDLGVCCELGAGVPKDVAEAFKWYRKAAKAGDARGMVVCFPP